MSKYLIATCETYRVDTEEEAEALIKEAKEENLYELGKYQCIKRQVKQKGEIVDEYYRVILNKNFDEEKDPSNNISVIYEE